VENYFPHCGKLALYSTPVIKNDALVYELCGLTPSEIALAQGNQTPSGEKQPPSL